MGIAAIVVAIAALALTGCAATPRATSRPLLLPSVLDTVLWHGCIAELDLGGDLGGMDLSIGGISGELIVDVGPGDIFDGWYVHATGRAVTLVDPADSAVMAEPGQVHAAEYAARAVQRCAAAYRFADANDMPPSRSGLLQLYRYDVAVLWPCLRAHGVTVAEQPSRDRYLTPVSAAAIDPYGFPNWTPAGVTAAVDAARDCPDIPTYLVNR